MLKLKKSEWSILIGLLILSFIPSVGGTIRLIDLTTGEDFLDVNPRIQSAPLPVIYHIISSVVFCILGALQFLANFRMNHLDWHRLVGCLIVTAGLVSALSGVWMTHYYSFPSSLQGGLLYWVRFIVGISITVFIVLGLKAVLNKRISQHQAWMMRAYALGQGAGTQVLITIPWLMTVGEPSGVFRDVLMTTGWVINLIVAELIVSKYKPLLLLRLEGRC